MNTPETAAKHLQDALDVQTTTGNWDVDPYQHGLANGLLLAQAYFTFTEPKFLNEPAKWLNRRAEVFRAIDSERRYQNAQRGNAKRHANMPPVMTPGECILTMEKCLNDARVAWYAPEGGTACLEHLRKVAAVAVQCMENYGAPIRQ
jgi:hypothetical protein